MVEKSNSSKRMNLANSSSIEIPKLVHFGHPSMETYNVGNLLGGIFTTRIETRTGSGVERTGEIGWRIRMILKLYAKRQLYRKQIRDSEIETRESLELEMSNKNIENIVTRLDKT